MCRCRCGAVQVGSRQFDLRFCDAAKVREFDVESAIEVHVVPGAPAAWQLCPGPGALRVSESGEWSVAAGEAFSIVVDACDEHGNR